MAKDYFQDILPPDDAPRRPAPSSTPPAPAPKAPIEDIAEETRIPINTNPSTSDTAQGERSIRNISVQRRSRSDNREPIAGVMVSPPRKGGAKWLLWLGASASIVVLGILILVALRSTTVDVTPRAQKVTFDAASQFTAYPAESAAPGTLAYTTRTLELEDSEVVASTGTTHVDEKASGSITVYNDYQTTPLKLVKNTRFATPDGLIFRAPADIVVPAKKGTTPGQITITVVADQPGEKYNVAPGKFTVPGLKTSPSYTKVYAQSTQAMTGGFSGDRPGVDPATMAAAVATVRARLETKARDSIGTATGDTLIIPDLVRVSYEEAAPTTEAGGDVRLHEKAHVAIPSLSSGQLAELVAVNAGIQDSGVTLVPESDFGAQILTASSTMGTDPLQFTLTGSATIVWSVDTAALQKALAGKPQAAFQGIVKDFPGIQEAHARVEPFWRSVFPADPAAITVTVGEPQAQ